MGEGSLYEMNHLTIPQLESKLLQWVSDSEESGKVWAEKKALYESLEDKKKPLVAVLMERFDGSNAHKETKALAHEEYKTFLAGLKEARLEYYQSQVAYDAANRKIEVLRSLLSARKEEVKNFRG